MKTITQKIIDFTCNWEFVFSQTNNSHSAFFYNVIVHLLDVDMTLCRFILIYTNVMKVRHRSRFFWKSALYENRTGSGCVSAAGEKGRCLAGA